MKITFCLRTYAPNSEATIAAYVHWKNHGGHQQLKFATGLRVHAKFWNQKRRRVRTGAMNEALINARLAAIESEVQIAFDDVQRTHADVTPDALKDRLSASVDKPQSSQSRSLADEYDAFIERSTTFTRATKKNHRKALNHLRAFTATHAAPLLIEQLDIPTLEAFTSYLLHNRMMWNDSAWSILKCLRAFLAASHAHGTHSSTTFQYLTRKRLIPRTESTDHAFLTSEELDAVIKLDLRHSRRLERVRDLFVFHCLTGLRFGDGQAIRPGHRTGTELRITTGKNRKEIIVPLHPAAVTILSRYEDRLPQINNQQANEYLCQVLALAGITQQIHVVRYSGTRRIERTHRKCDIIGTHGAKRTFVTLSLLRGVSIEALARVTGNSVSTLRTYDVRTVNDAIAEIRRSWQTFEVPMP